MPPRKNVAAVKIVDIKEAQQEITPEAARQLLGVRPAKEEEAGIRLEGEEEKVVFANNDANRPFQTGLAKQYAEQMLRQEWAGQKKSPSKTSNGEPIIIGTRNKIVSGAHRLAAILIAEARRARLELVEAWDELKSLGWKKGEQVAILAPLFGSVDNKAADTVDTGKSRSLADVLFRRNEFGGEELNENQKKKLSSILSHAVRLVWLRSSGQRVARGGKLYHPEAIEFLEQHPLLHDAVFHIYTEEGGGGQEGKRISSILSLGYAAGMMYLMAFSGCNREDIESGKVKLDQQPDEWDLAAKFWTEFAHDIHSKENPVKSLHKLLTKNAMSEEKYSRDAICTLISRAWLAYTGNSDGKWGTTRALAQKLYTKEGDKEVLNFERIGGLDLDRETLMELGVITEDVAPQRVSSGDWKVDDTCWVNQRYASGDVEMSWFGRIVEISDDGNVFHVLSLDDDEVYPAEKEWLDTEPVRIEETEEEEEEDPVPFEEEQEEPVA